MNINIKTIPFALALVTSGSRGTRLLFYTRGKKENKNEGRS